MLTGLEDVELWAPAGGPNPRLSPDLGPSEGLRATNGERVTRRFFELCENPRSRQRMMRLLQSSADSAVAGRLSVAMLSRTVFTPLLRLRRVDGAAARVELVAAQLGGIAVLRYVTRMEPVTSMAVDDLVAMVAPSVQATLDSGPSRPR